MIQTTIGDLLAGKLHDLDTRDHHLYVVRDGDVVFYVGKSRCVITRLLGPSGSGSFAAQNVCSGLSRRLAGGADRGRHEPGAGVGLVFKPLF